MRHDTPSPSTRRGAVGVIMEQDRFLVIRRSATVRAPNMLCFPGGSIEVGESPEAAVVRELSEELQLTTTVNRWLWSSVTGWGTQLEWFLMDHEPSVAPIPNPAEVAEYFWIAPPALLRRSDVLASVPDFFRAWSTGQFELHHPIDGTDWFHLLGG